MLTAFPLDSDRFGHVLPCDVAVTGECNGWHLYNWGFDAPPGQTQMPAPTENRDPQCADRTASLQVDPTCDSQTLPQTTAGTSVQVNVQDVSQTASARVVFDAYRTIQPGSLQVSLNGSAWQMVPWLSTPNDGGWVNQWSEPLRPDHGAKLPQP
jgi:hypothetical protein